jgi:phage terminase large subunit-like protein
MVIADELWGFTTEASQRLYEECCPTPTRKPSVRMVTTYAGFVGESVLLEKLINRGLAGKQIGKDLYAQLGIIAFVSHDRIAPWQSLEWFEEAKSSTRPTAFMRQYENRFAAAESQFIPIEAWDAVTDQSLRPLVSDRDKTIFVGLDCSVRKDTTAIVAAAFESKTGRVRIVTHKCFRPTSFAPIDFGLVEATLKDLESRFTVASVTYDPFQAEYLAQRLVGAGIRMQALPQTSDNLTQAASTLSELILGGNIVTYPSDELREAVRNAAIVESSRGMRLAKERPGAKIDLLAAMSFACLSAVREGQHAESGLIGWYAQQFKAAGLGDPEPVDTDDLVELYNSIANAGSTHCTFCGKKLGQQKQWMGPYAFCPSCPVQWPNGRKVN